MARDRANVSSFQERSAMLRLAVSALPGVLGERSQTGAPSQTVFPHKHSQTQFPANPRQQRSVPIHLSCFTRNTSHVCPPVSFGNGGLLYSYTQARKHKKHTYKQHAASWGLSHCGQFLPGLIRLISCPASTLYMTTKNAHIQTHTHINSCRL